MPTSIYTDLAMESRELNPELQGVKEQTEEGEGISISRIEVETEEAAQKLEKPVGHYITLDAPELTNRPLDLFEQVSKSLATELARLLEGVGPQATVLVVGLGNRAITPDAIGPGAADHTMVTRHLVEQVPEHFGSFRPVSALAAGVLGTTGVESGELVRALSDHINPQCVIAVDALASRSLKRVCTTVQISDTGIIPGSGVGNARAALNKKSLGVPVIAVGVPTVVDAATLAADLLEEAGNKDLDPKALSGGSGGLMVTPRDIDQRVADMSKVIGFGINLALQTGLTIEDVEMFLS